jgi:hypothetical protein
MKLKRQNWSPHLNRSGDRPQNAAHLISTRMALGQLPRELPRGHSGGMDIIGAILLIREHRGPLTNARQNLRA